MHYAKGGVDSVTGRTLGGYCRTCTHALASGDCEIEDDVARIEDDEGRHRWTLGQSAPCPLCLDADRFGCGEGGEDG